MAWPGKLPANKTYDRPVITLDILPTACALAGVKTPENADGVNLMPYLLGENKAAPHEALYWRFGPQKAIRKGNWSLVDFRDFQKKTDSGWQLFDLDKDIGQQNNIAAEHPKLVAELSQAWQRWDAQNIAQNGAAARRRIRPRRTSLANSKSRKRERRFADVLKSVAYASGSEGSSFLSRAFLSRSRQLGQIPWLKRRSEWTNR